MVKYNRKTTGTYEERVEGGRSGDERGVVRGVGELKLEVEGRYCKQYEPERG